ncbi:MAG: hypothetical protein ICV83_27665, partial [Cytophagales bacterium]|nr:hypothetical protein [Cytophagales bacterium]
FEDRHGWLWIVYTNGGLSYYDPVADAFTARVHDKNDPGSLSNNHITCHYTGRDGTVWIGTNHGLNRYDRAARSFRRYYGGPGSGSRLTDSYVTCLAEDRAGHLWVGTRHGLNRLERRTGQVTRFYNNASHLSLSANPVTHLLEDRDGHLWVGTGWGLNRSLQPLSATAHPAFGRFLNDPYRPGKINRQQVRCLFQSRGGDVWVGTPHGLTRIPAGRSPGAPVHYLAEARYANLEGLHPVDLIREDHDGNLWAAASGSDNGLFRFEPGRDAFVQYRHNPLDPLSLGSNEIRCLAADRQGILWIGTWKGGVSKLNPYRKEFYHYRHVPGQANSLYGSSVLALAEDARGDLWIGTSKGLNKLDRQTYRYTHYEPDPARPGGLPARIVGVIRSLPGDRLWLGFFDGKISRFDPGRNRFENFLHRPEDSTAFRAWSPRSILTDRAGNTWFGTCTHTLVQLDRDGKTFRYYWPEPADGDRRTENVGWAILEADSTSLWLGTRKSGLVQFNRRTGAFTYYWHDPANPHSLSHNDVRSLYRDGDGSLWVGTYGGGLNRFDPATGRFRRYTTRDGLPSDVIHGMLDDDAGNLWLSTNRGLSKFDRRRGRFRNYSAQDGLQGNEFNEGAYLKGRSGELFFGGANGVNAFFPGRIRDNPFPPALALTQLRLFNQPVRVGDTVQGGVVLRQALPYAAGITLTHRQNDFTFEFAALHYAEPLGIRYAYRLEPYDREWKYTDALQRYATYTNLPAGSYTFRVKAANADGVWNQQGAALAVRILPPWWQTWWWRLVVSCSAVAALGGFYQYRLGRARRVQALLEEKVAHRTQSLEAAKGVIEQKNAQLRERMVQQERQKQEIADIAQRLHRADQAKIQFFTNVSHELRTPLSLILGPLEDLLEKHRRVEAGYLETSLGTM